MIASGVSGLTWEVLWQHHASLTFGVSAFGTAITLAAVMAGLGLGGLVAARLAQSGRLLHPLRAFAFAELTIGVGALLVPLGLRGLAALDATLYALAPAAATTAQVLGTAFLILVPATAMGTTLPFVAPYAERSGLGIARAYACNLLGAVCGVLATTFLFIPLVGVLASGWLAAAGNLGVARWALARASAQSRNGMQSVPDEAPAAGAWPPLNALGLAFTTGFAIFILEVSWFRSLRAALQSTTESFALILASFLLALAVGGAVAARLQARHATMLGGVLATAALFVLAATPAIDAFDLLATHRFGIALIPEHFSFGIALSRLGLLFALVLVPVGALGMAFPWLLAAHATTAGCGRLYAVNTLGAVAGAVLAGFVLLPTLGATHTSWLAGGAVFLMALIWTRRTPSRLAVAALAVLGFFAAHRFDAGPATARVQGVGMGAYEEILYVDEGPDSTVWVARHDETDNLALVIDGFVATAEHPRASYMAWMGHLPALTVKELETALVICFGTGQTADAVRQHGPRRLDLVDVNEAVFAAAPLFPSNHAVLGDPRSLPTVMDGRAFLRRTQQRYDLVTLEPMPPNFAGSNNLYAREFYTLVRDRLKADGVMAQWVPFHLLAPYHMRAIIATAVDVFPYTRLWIDPGSGTGILVGGSQPWALRASTVPLPLSDEAIAQGFVLDREEVAALAAGVELITDNNQLLTYGYDRFIRANGRDPAWFSRLGAYNRRIVQRFRTAG